MSPCDRKGRVLRLSGRVPLGPSLSVSAAWRVASSPDLLRLRPSRLLHRSSGVQSSTPPGTMAPCSALPGLIVLLHALAVAQAAVGTCLRVSVCSMCSVPPVTLSHSAQALEAGFNQSKRSTFLGIVIVTVYRMVVM